MSVLWSSNSDYSFTKELENEVHFYCVGQCSLYDGV